MITTDISLDYRVLAIISLKVVRPSLTIDNNSLCKTCVAVGVWIGSVIKVALGNALAICALKGIHEILCRTVAALS